MHTWEMHAWEMHTREMHAWEMHTREMHAWEMHSNGLLVGGGYEIYDHEWNSAEVRRNFGVLSLSFPIFRRIYGFSYPSCPRNPLGLTTHSLHCLKANTLTLPPFQQSLSSTWNALQQSFRFSEEFHLYSHYRPISP